MRDGGYFVRVRVTDRRTGRRVQCARTLRGAGVTIWDAVRVRDQLRREGRDRVEGKIRSLPLWSEYAASLFEAKVAEGKLSSSKSRERWGNVLGRLLPVFGRLRVDEVHTADIVGWRDQVARWICDGMPSARKRDEGKNKLVRLSPVTANGWLSILKVICAAMTKYYELARDPAKPVEYFQAPRKYTREQPNALTAAQIPVFVAKMKELHPQHYAMVLLGFGIGARPSTLRILRAISGHQTERMQRHYSTAQQEEMRAAVGKVISIATARQLRRRRARKRL